MGDLEAETGVVKALTEPVTVPVAESGSAKAEPAHTRAKQRLRPASIQYRGF